MEGSYAEHAKLEICRDYKPGKKIVTRYQLCAGVICERRQTVSCWVGVQPLALLVNAQADALKCGKKPLM
ncbi:hypothetical protein DBR37_01750 [Herminiimonas sp. KBW02]|nr:hypothetical protein DBR37_01750 [Herminiimonas sp. KBW02]